MPFTEHMNAELAKKLDPANVRPPSKFGPKGDYIEGWHAIAEANRIFGFDGWTRETVRLEQVAQYERKIGQDKKDGWSVTYIAKVRVTAHGVVREGSGSGHGIGVDLGEAHESALKEAETDAMKRAMMTFGNPFGLALYDKTRENVGAPAPETIGSEAAIALGNEIKAVDGDEKKILEHFGVTALPMLTPAQAAAVRRSLQKAKGA
jgi:DNA repair and recombination protein RAD52